MSIQVLDHRVFHLRTATMSYVLYISQEGVVCNSYWGPSIDKTEDFADAAWFRPYSNASVGQAMSEECSAFGNTRTKETSFKITYKDGSRDFRYHVSGYDIKDNLLSITLKDDFYPLSLTLYYRVYEDENIIEKWREVKNLGKEPVVIEKICSGEFSLSGTQWQSTNYSGHWSGEFQLNTDPIGCGIKTYESLHLTTGHNHAPAFVLHQNATEDNGDVYFGMLAWSGNFKISMQAVEGHYTNILAGINDRDFQWHLKGGESFLTPPVYAGHAQGFTAMTHRLTHFAQKRIMPPLLAHKPLPILYNSWESTEFHVAEQQQMHLAEKAAALGVELFVVDDGWFHNRSGDTCGLGDWWADEKKFPKGLQPLISHVKSLGMSFGLWIEPEMTNEDSDLFRQHPNWVYRYENRPILTSRNQYVLDMTNPQVIEYLYNAFHKLLTQNDIAFIKWDMNRYAFEVGTSTLPAQEYQSIWYRHVKGVYQLIDRLRKAHTHVEWECCASGGGRVDYGAMAFFDEFWPSDNTDPLDRLLIQWGYSFLYPIKYMRAWLTHGGALNKRTFSTDFYAHAAMCGNFGISRDLLKADDEEIKKMTDYVLQYKKIRDVVQLGDLYRLTSFASSPLQAVQYVLEGKSVLFAFVTATHFGRPYHHIKLKGLAPHKQYRYTLKDQSYEKSGQWLMNHGIHLLLEGAFTSSLIEFTAL